MASPANLNGSFLHQSEPQNFPPNPTGPPPPNQYPAPQDLQGQQQQQDQPPAEDLPKDEVGWYFVEQYYTTLNKDPSRLHLFYDKKKSVFVWGTEGESVPVAHGRTEIQGKITAHDFKGCNVRVSNVDSQGSLNGGIIIQVLGEMSNNEQPTRKFVQTFFLAEQQSGFFVVNDIFRYLKDDEDIETGEDEYDYAAEEAAEAAAEELVADTVEAITEAVEDAVEIAREEVVEELAEEIQDLSVKETTTIEVAEEENKVTIEETHTIESTQPEAEPEPEATETPSNGIDTNGDAEEAAPPAPAEPEAAPEVKPEPEKAPTPTPVPQKAPEPAKAPPAPAQPAAPPKPKTWANLVAASSTTRAPPATTAAPVPQASATTQPTESAEKGAPAAAQSTTAAPAAAAAQANKAGQDSQWQTADSKRHSRAAVPAGVTNAYIKNVTEGVTENALKEALLKFGELTHFEVNRQKNCAFATFKSPAAFTKANNANPHAIGGSNVLVEERRPRQGGRGDGRPFNQGGRGGYVTRDGQRYDGGGRGRGGAGRGFMRGGGPKA